MKLKLLLFIFILNFLLIDSIRPQQIIFKTYGVQDGLVANSVRKIFQDSKGFIWIATWEGLSKYDGNKFTSYTTSNGLSFNLINDLYESADGGLYVAENNGSIDVLRNDKVIKQHAFNRVVTNRFFSGSDGKVHLLTDSNGIHTLEVDKLAPVYRAPEETIYAMNELNDSLYVIGSYESSLHILNKNYQVFAHAKNQYHVENIYKDNRQRLWACTYQGLKMISPVQKKNQPITFLPIPASFQSINLDVKPVTDILEDKNGNFWVATSTGLIKISPKGIVNRYTMQNGLPSNLISCLYEDIENNIWVGTQQGVVKIVTRNDIQIIQTSHGLAHDEVWNVLPLNNALYLLAGNEFQVIDPEMNSLKPPPIKFKPGYYYMLRVDNGIAFLSAAGLEIITAGNRGLQRKMVFQGPYKEYACFTKDSAGNFFIGKSNGLEIYIGRKKITDTSLPKLISTLMFDKEGYLWAGTWTDGLYRLQLHYAPDTVWMSIKNFSSLLPDKFIRSSYMDRAGNLWFGTRYNGVVKLSGLQNGAYETQHFNHEDGLLSDFVRTIAEDKYGNIWIGTLHGIDKLIPEKNTYRVFSFSRVNNFFAIVNAIQPFGDILWCATYPGLVQIRDNQLDTMQPLKVRITSVVAGIAANQKIDLLAEKNLSLRHNNNALQFEYAAPGFINEKQIMYSYRLKGSNDTSWSLPTNSHNIYYASLQPGSYEFEVRALGWNNSWGKPATFSFIILPPFWKTWWFISLIALVILALMYLLYRYRISQLLKVQQVRNRIATDLHDDIGSALTNISILSELSRKKLEQPREANQFLERITEEVTTSSQALDDIIWSVNAKNDSLDETIARMRRYAAELFEGGNITCHLDLDQQFDGRKLSMEERRDVFLIYKEALNNIYKHAGADTVWINVKLEKNFLHLSIKDNGKGFDISTLTHRNGIKNIRSRAEKWNGRLVVQSDKNSGTSIELRLPV